MALVVVTAFRLETRAVLAALAQAERVRPAARPCWRGRAGAGDVVVVEGGVGPDGARAAVGALPPETTLVVSTGFAGALAPELAPGDVILASEVVWEEGSRVRRHTTSPALLDAVAGALTDALGAPRIGGVLSSPVVVAGVAGKRAAFDRHGALAVEMEAAVLAEAAEVRSVPFVALRIVLDPADLSLEALPPNLEQSWMARARLATTPTVWPLLGTLRRHAATAGTELTRTLRAALPVLVGLRG
jgi:nucleoside phosphorylase